MNDLLEQNDEKSLLYKVTHINWGFVLLICAIAGVGFLCLYSAAGGDFDPWASRQIQRFILGSFVMFGVAMISPRWWLRLSVPIYILGMILLLIVEIIGHTGGGAQRWINLGFMKLQPSEMMKIAVVMALARYFHAATIEDMRNLRFLIVPAIIIALPVSLVLLQPDLGTSLMIIMAGAGIFFVAGAPLYLFLTAGGLTLVSIPIAWQFLKEYQKKRVMTFLNPESDPLGSGYHITQSKIALGSGGIDGKGFMQGTQSHLNFLPEKQTDFIFTLWAEEWGFLGGVFLLAMLGFVFLYGHVIAFQCKHAFGRLMSFGLMLNFSLYVFINIAMVMGLIPVVGAPLPLVSYGGTAMLAVMISFGLMMSCSIHRDAKLPRM